MCNFGPGTSECMRVFHCQIFSAYMFSQPKIVNRSTEVIFLVQKMPHLQR